MNAFQATVTVLLALNHISFSISPLTRSLVGLSKRIDTLVGDAATLHQTDTLQLGEVCQADHRIIGQIDTAAEVNIADAVAAADESLHSLVSNLVAVSEMQIMQVFAKP